MLHNDNILKMIFGLIFLVFVITIIFIFIIGHYSEKTRKKIEKLNNEKNTLLEEINSLRIYISKNNSVTYSLIENIKYGLLVFDESGILQSFNNLSKDIIASDLDIGNSLYDLYIKGGASLYNVISEVNLEQNAEKSIKVNTDFDIKISSAAVKIDGEILGLIVLIKR